jgi:hypothetical protein
MGILDSFQILFLRKEKNRYSSNKNFNVFNIRCAFMKERTKGVAEIYKNKVKKKFQFFKTHQQFSAKKCAERS